MKILGIILIVVGLGLAAPVGLITVQQSRSAGAHLAAIDSLTIERKAAVEELSDVNLKLRAIMKSINVQPDSLRFQESGKISQRMQELSQRARQLTMNQTELARLIRREKRLLDEESVAARERSRPFAIAAAACVLTGAVLTAVGRRQRA
jgi:hypothetical protein